MRRNDSKKAFTMAEVIITLAIIGIIAAMTIPSIIAKVRQNEYRTAGKKAFSDLSAAVQTANLKHNMPVENYVNASDVDKAKFYNIIENTLNVIKKDVDADGNTTLITNDGFIYHIVNVNEYYVDVNTNSLPTKIDTPKSEWEKAQYEDEADLFENASWSKVELSDIFYIGFNPETGKGIVLPYIDNVISVAFPNLQTNTP